MTVADIVRESSNVGTIQIARELGKERFDAACARSGSARRRASASRARPRACCCRSTSTTTRAWRRCRSATASRSPRCRCSTCTSTIANDGVARPPRLVDRDHRRRRQAHEAAARRDAVRSCRPRPPQRCSTHARGGRYDGTGTKAQIPGTGGGQDRDRAQAPVRRAAVQYMASFAGFAPAESRVSRRSSCSTSPGRTTTAVARWLRRCSRGSCSTRSPSSGCRRRQRQSADERAARGDRYPDAGSVTKWRGSARAARTSSSSGSRSLAVRGDRARRVDALTHDSRLVRARRLLLLHSPASTTDGHDHAPAAVAAGAVALLVERPLGLGVAEAEVAERPRARSGPPRPRSTATRRRRMRCLGRHRHQRQDDDHVPARGDRPRRRRPRRRHRHDRRTASTGEPVPLEHTTPEATELQALLARMRDAGRRDRRDGGVVARARPAPGRRHLVRRGRASRTSRTTTSTTTGRSSEYFEAKARLFRRRPGRLPRS